MDSSTLNFDAKLPGLELVDFLVVFSQWEERDQFKGLCSDVTDRGEDTFGNVHRIPIPESYRVALLVCGQDNMNSHEATQSAILRVRPRAVILCGICAGPKESRINEGDIVVPRWIIPYERAKHTEEHLGTSERTSPELKVEMRDFPYDVSQRLWKSAEALAHRSAPSWEDDQLFDLRPTRPHLTPKVHIGEQSFVGSGDKNIATELSPVRRRLIQKFGKDLLGFEMEAYGVLRACRTHDRSFLMIKAVQDDATAEKDGTKKDNWRAFACRTAALFTHSVIQHHRFLIELPRSILPTETARTSRPLERSPR